MSNRLYDTTQISRRKVLAGLGTIGVAAAGAGIGTSAFFSDREDFRENRLVAGSLDMLVDWEEHYYDGSVGGDIIDEYVRNYADAEYFFPAAALNAAGEINTDALPIGVKYLGDNTQDDFWDATTIEAFPDGNQDGKQDDFSDVNVCGSESPLTNVGNNGEGVGLDHPDRTQNDDTVGDDDEALPLINLADVKPGDFGEVTFSFHLCDNPGYVWVNGRLVSAAENGETEPEASDKDSNGAANESYEVDVDTEVAIEDITVELLDEILVRMFYDDDCDNQLESDQADLMIVADTSISVDEDEGEMTELKSGLQAFVDGLPTDGSVEAGFMTFGNNSLDDYVGIGDVTRLQTGGTDEASSKLPNDGSGNTPMAPALDVADQVLNDEGRTGVNKTIVLFTDGGPNYDNQSYTLDGTYTAPRDNTYTQAGDGNYQTGSGVSQAEKDETAFIAEKIRDSGTRIVVGGLVDASGDPGPGLLDYLAAEIASDQPSFNEIQLSNLVVAADSLIATTLAEEQFFRGTLRDALIALEGNDGRGIPLDGDRSTPFNEVYDEENDEDREGFSGDGNSHCVAFEWWLPVDHANQIQTDSVSFDIGFYTEQERHNDGAGMVPDPEVQA
jgi:hypothetical protein